MDDNADVDDDAMDDAGKPRLRRCAIYTTTTQVYILEHESKVPVIRDLQGYRSVQDLGILFRPIPSS